MNTQKIKSNNLKKSDKNLSITEDQMINEVLLNIGKKNKNSENKNLINEFVNNKALNNKLLKKNDEKEEINNLKKDTYTSKLTKDDIQDKLEDYKQVDDLSKVPLGTHLRYFIKKDGEMLFRMGGNLKINTGLPKFVVLKNAQNVEWTVQVEDTLFYKKMSISEIKEEYEKIIEELNAKVKKLKNKIKELEK